MIFHFGRFGSLLLFQIMRIASDWVAYRAIVNVPVANGFEQSE